MLFTKAIYIIKITVVLLVTWYNPNR